MSLLTDFRSDRDAYRELLDALDLAQSKVSVAKDMAIDKCYRNVSGYVAYLDEQIAFLEAREIAPQGSLLDTCEAA